MNKEKTLQGVTTEIIDTAYKLYFLIREFEQTATIIRSFDKSNQTQVHWHGSDSVIAPQRVLDAIGAFQEVYENQPSMRDDRISKMRQALEAIENLGTEHPNCESMDAAEAVIKEMFKAANVALWTDDKMIEGENQNV